MAELEILDPVGEPSQPRSKLASRPRDLNGKLLWFVDGEGEAGESGVAVMNKIFRGWRNRLERQFDLRDIRYVRTDDIGTPFRHGKDTFEEIVNTADVVINGVAL